MDTGSQDQLSAFCEAYTLQHRDKWPTSEQELAAAFVSHFGIPTIVMVADLQDFLARANIELIERDFPSDLLGVNMSFGVRRQIFTSKNADHLAFRVHTVLHEIREIIEGEFRRLGFITANSSQLDSRADAFSFAVHFCAAMPSIQFWVKDILETNSTWQQFVSFGLFTIHFVLVGMFSFIGAYGYRFQSSSIKRSRLTHI